MIQKFKFGDIVRHKTKGVCVVYCVEGAFVALINNDGETIVCTEKQYFLCNELRNLEPIPHPDTLRLEKIGRLSVEAMGMAFDLDEYRRQIDQIGEQA